MRILIVVISTIIVLLNINKAHSQPSIDLDEAKVNDVSVCGLGIDEITDLMGRPTAIDRDHPNIGISLKYHEKGLEFRFMGTDFIESQPLNYIRIYLSRVVDDESSGSYHQYRGVMSPEINGNFKMVDIKDLFSDKNIKIETPEDRENAMKEAGIDTRNKNYPYKSIMGYDGHQIVVSHESLTKFSETVNIACNVDFDNSN